MKWLSNTVTKYPKVVILLILMVTILLGIQALDVTMTTNIKDFFPDDHPRVVTYEQVEQTFGSAEYIMVALEMDDIFTTEGLTAIDQLTTELEAVAGVASVRSLTTVEEIKASEWGIEIGPLIDVIPQMSDGFGELKTRVLADPMYVGSMVAVDGSAALHMIEVEAEADPIKTALNVQEVVENIQVPGSLYLTGTPVLNAVLADSMQADLKLLLPIVLALIAVILYLYFRNLRGVILPFLTVIISLVWTLGFMSLFNKQMSPLNAVMPVILVSLSNAYGIYLLTRFNSEIAAGHNRRQAVKIGLATVGIAVLLAGTTTIAGFGSNITSSITQMRDFGIFTAVGVLVALIVSLTLVPALWVLMPNAQQSKRKQNGNLGILAKLLRWIGRVVGQHYRLVIMAAVVLVIIALLGIPQISTDSNFFNFFDSESQPRIAYDLVADKFSGSQSVEIVIEGEVLKPEVLQAMADFQTDLEATGLVGSPMSIVSILERMNQAMHDGNPSYAQVPQQHDLIAQYLLLLEMSGASMVERFLTMDYHTARIQTLVSDTSSKATATLFAELDRLSTVHFANLDITVTHTGMITLLDALANLIIAGQVKSLIFALIAVFVIVRLLLHSWEGSILSTLLVGITILGNFGLMGWLGIPLDIVTVLISSIGIGVGIDYAIHIYSRFQENCKQGMGVGAAIEATITATGKAIVVNAVAVISGFVILLSSSFPPFRYFGSLVTMIMLFASLGSLTVLPALILFRNSRRVQNDKCM